MWSVGNGNYIFFWYDNWIENKNLIELLDLSGVTGLDPQTKVSKFIQDKKLNLHKLYKTISNHFLVQKIIGIPISNVEVRDVTH